MEFSFCTGRNENWLYTTYFITGLVVQFVCEYFLGKKIFPFCSGFKKVFLLFLFLLSD